MALQKVVLKHRNRPTDLEYKEDPEKVDTKDTAPCNGQGPNAGGGVNYLFLEL